MSSALENRIHLTIFRRMFLKLLPSQILFYFVTLLSSLISTFLVGNYLPPISMSAIGLCFPLVTGSIFFKITISCGSAVVCSKAMGRGDTALLSKLFFLAILLIAFSSAILFILFYCFGEEVLTLLGTQDKKLLQESVSYLKAISFDLFPGILNPTLIIFLQLGNETSRSMYSSLIQLAGNIISALFFTFVLQYGLFGIGLSVTTGSFCSFFYLMSCFYLKKNLIRPIPCFSWKLLLNIIWIGLPSSFLILAGSCRDIFIVSGLAKYGAECLAGFAITKPALIIFVSIANGISGTYTILAGLIAGERDKKMLERAFSEILKFAAVIVIFLNFCYILLAKEIAVIFGASGTALSYTAFFICCFSATLMLYELSLIFINTYQSVGRIKTILLIHLCSKMIFPLISLLFLEHFFGVYGIYTCFVAAEVLCIILTLLICRVHCGRIPRNAADCLWLDKDFPKVDGVSISINSYEEAIGLSTRMESYCTAHSIPKNTAYKSALCLEELTMNIIKYGFRSKKNTIDIFFYVEADSVHIRIRDNGIPFDPYSKLKMHSRDPLDPCKNIGIRMVSALAKEMTYQTTFGMNTLHIII